MHPDSEHPQTLADKLRLPALLAVLLLSLLVVGDAYALLSAIPQ